MDNSGSGEGNGWVDFSDLSRTRAHAHKGLGIKEEIGGRRGDARGEGGGRGTIKTLRVTVAEVLEAFPAPSGLEEAWREWVETRIERGMQNRWTTDMPCFRQSMKKCERWGKQRAIVAIEFSIEAGYRGLFEPLYQQSQFPQQLNGKKRYNPRTDPDRSVLS